MSRRSDFLLAVQTFLLRREEATDVIALTLVQAFALPEESIPENAAQAALEFVRHVTMPIGYARPEWLLAYDEAVGAERVRVSAVRSPWWQQVPDSGYEHALPASLHEFLGCRVDQVVVPKGDAEALMDWAANLPGYDYEAEPFEFWDAEGEQRVGLARAVVG